ncbi:MAG: hypothetical protein Q6353_011620 [Candidatus Sigynarchaeum springense]
MDEPRDESTKTRSFPARIHACASKIDHPGTDVRLYLLFNNMLHRRRGEKLLDRSTGGNYRAFSRPRYRVPGHRVNRNGRQVTFRWCHSWHISR